MPRDWEVFNGIASTHAVDALYVTINPAGEILMNRYTFEAIGRPAYASLMFDRRGHSIGLRPAEASRPNVFEVKAKSKDINRVVRAMPFLRKFDMKFDETVRFREAAIEDGVLVLNLRRLDTVMRRGGRRRK